MRTHTISVLVENHSGALSRISGLFSSRGYNITSLNVAETEDDTISRMTIVVKGDDNIIEQVVKQLNRLIDVIKVVDFSDGHVMSRELVLLRINATHSVRHEIASLVSIYNGSVIAVCPTSMTIELTGDEVDIEDFILNIKPYGIKELIRTGKIAVSKSGK